MADVQKTPFVRELASSGTSMHQSDPIERRKTDQLLLLLIDRKARDKALESLTLFLRSRTDLTLLDLLKLWKGLFFCMPDSTPPKSYLKISRLTYLLLTRLLPLRPTSHATGSRAGTNLLPRSVIATFNGASLSARVLDHHWTRIPRAGPSAFGQVPVSNSMLCGRCI